MLALRPRKRTGLALQACDRAHGTFNRFRCAPNPVRTCSWFGAVSKARIESDTMRPGVRNGSIVNVLGVSRLCARFSPWCAVQSGKIA